MIRRTMLLAIVGLVALGVGLIGSALATTRQRFYRRDGPGTSGRPAPRRELAFRTREQGEASDARRGRDRGSADRHPTGRNPWLAQPPGSDGGHDLQWNHELLPRRALHHGDRVRAGTVLLEHARRDPHGQEREQLRGAGGLRVLLRAGADAAGGTSDRPAVSGPRLSPVGRHDRVGRRSAPHSARQPCLPRSSGVLEGPSRPVREVLGGDGPAASSEDLRESHP